MATPNELVEIGSGARLAGKTIFARRIYEPIRARYPGTNAAASAAFHLGRMAFDGRGALDDAVFWFEASYRERPHGTFAAEALGRLIECAVRAGDTTRAHRLSRQYMGQFPIGGHADLARRLANDEQDPTILPNELDGGTDSQ